MENKGALFIEMDGYQAVDGTIHCRIFLLHS
jgi:hypothetical protein